MAIQWSEKQIRPNLPFSLIPKIASSIVDTDDYLLVVSKQLDPLADEATPGQRLSDSTTYMSHIHTDFTVPRSEEELWARRDHLDSIQASATTHTALVGVDGSVPNDKSMAATAAYVLKFAESRRQSVINVGKATASDAELAAIRFAVSKAIKQPGVDKIVVFSDSLAAMRKALDASLHSGQAHSIAICSGIRKWIGGGSHAQPRNIHFVHVPSKLEWDIHQEAHELAKARRVPTNKWSDRTLDFARKQTVSRMLDEWSRLFRQTGYHGRQFLLLTRNGKLIQPNHIKGGPWLKDMGQSNAHTARMTRALLNHAPTGEYRARFHPSEETGCKCNPFILESRRHILYRCPKHIRHREPAEAGTLKSFLGFLERNPTSFAFPSAEPPPPFPQARTKKKKCAPDKGHSSTHPGHYDPNHGANMTEQAYNALFQERALTINDVWVPRLHQFVDKDVADSNGWSYEDAFFR